MKISRGSRCAATEEHRKRCAQDGGSRLRTYDCSHTSLKHRLEIQFAGRVAGFKAIGTFTCRNAIVRLAAVVGPRSAACAGYDRSPSGSCSGPACTPRAARKRAFELDRFVPEAADASQQNAFLFGHSSGHGAVIDGIPFSQSHRYRPFRRHGETVHALQADAVA